MPLAYFGDYEVEGCREDSGYVAGGYSASDANFFGVYERMPPDGLDGHRYAIHIADFAYLADAIDYAQFRAAKENT